jgi:hypothetical protein
MTDQLMIMYIQTWIIEFKYMDMYDLFLSPLMQGLCKEEQQMEVLVRFKGLK